MGPTTLGRYFARPEIKKQLKQVVRQLRAEQRPEPMREPDHVPRPFRLALTPALHRD